MIERENKKKKNDNMKFSLHFKLLIFKDKNVKVTLK